MTENLPKALEILALGWGGVFVVLIIIYLASLALAKLFPVKKS
ncbi:OadG-related small transporter subunit [Lactovum odontotermitis]